MIINYMFDLEKNSYTEIMQLLDYHKEREEEFIDAFFTHYYHKQWYSREQFDDETVTEIIRDANGKVIGVIGNDYNQDGRLYYTGSYKNKKFHGEGKMFTDDGGYYQGPFENGVNGSFELHTERGITRRDVFVNGLKHGECIEYYDNGKIKSRCQYIDGKRSGPAFEFAGDGSLLFKGTYQNDKRVGEGFEYICSCICKKGIYDDQERMTNVEYYYHFNPELRFGYKNPVYTDNYYNEDPIPFLISVNDNGYTNHILSFLAVCKIYDCRLMRGNNELIFPDRGSNNSGCTEFCMFCFTLRYD